MATFDQLSDEQRAIVELVLRRGKSYAELAGMLDMPEGRVRELARAALVELAPVSVAGVEEDWRGGLADYVLGQQAGPEVTATRGHLRRSEGARSWTRSLLDSLEQLYPNGSLPLIPDTERGVRRTRSEARPERRRLLALAGGIAALLLIAILVWPVGVLTGDDDEPSGQAAADDGGRAAGQGAASGQAIDGKAAGIAIVAQQGSSRSLLVRASKLPPSGDREAYEVWLYNSPDDARSLGGQVTDAQGQYQAIGAFPRNYRRYRFIDISREPLDQDGAHSGESVLRGPMPRLRQAETGAGRTAVLGQTVLTPPGG